MAKTNDLPKLRVGPREIRGRSATEATMVRWVAENIDNGEVDPKTCPAPFAWTMLRLCRESDEYLEKTFMPMWRQLIPPKSQIENEAPKEQDGRSLIELSEQILAISREAQGLDPKEKTS